MTGLLGKIFRRRERDPGIDVRQAVQFFSDNHVDLRTVGFPHMDKILSEDPVDGCRYICFFSNICARPVYTGDTMETTTMITGDYRVTVVKLEPKTDQRVQERMGYRFTILHGRLTECPKER